MFKAFLILAPLLLILNSCRPLGDFTKTDPFYCFGGRNINGLCIKKEKPIISGVTYENGKLRFVGENLSEVNEVSYRKADGETGTLKIDSKEVSSLLTSGNSALNFIVGNIINFSVSSAYGEDIFSVSFTIPDGSVGSSKLSSMGATTGQVLKYNGTSWVPGDLSGLTYSGSWDAQTNTPDLLRAGNTGEYLIVSQSGSTDLSGGVGTDQWGVGDWVVWNDVLGQWEKINNATNVQSFNGRTGAVNPMAGDYTWGQVDKSTSSIGDIADVDVSGIAAGKVLKWNGASWVAGDDLSSGGSGSVTTAEILDGTILDVDISPFASISQSKIANLTTDLAGKENTIAAGTTSQYYRGDKTFQTLNTDAVSEGANQYFTSARAKSAAVVNSTLGNETDQAASVAAMKTYVASSAGTVTSISGGAGLSDGPITSSGTLDVNVDDQTIEISGDALNVKDGGITDAKIVSVSDNKITTACSDGQVLSASSGNFVCANAGALGSWSLNGTDLYYNGGNVGIGTSSPNSALQIRNDSGGISNFLSLRQAGTDWRIYPSNVYTGTPSLRIGGAGSSAYAWQFDWTGDSANIFKAPSNNPNQRVMELLGATGQTGDYLNLSSNGGSPGDILTVESNGNVGIGTTSPVGKLDVRGGDVFIGAGTLTNASANEDVSITGNLEVDGVIYGDGSGLTNLPSGTVTSITGGSGLSDGPITDSGTLNVNVDNTTIEITSDSLNIKDGAITDAKVHATASISQSKIANLTTDLAGKENTIAAGTTSQYYRGDKAFQTLDTDAVAEGTNQYFTSARAKSAAVVNSTLGNETDQAASVAAMKTYVASSAGSVTSISGGAGLSDGPITSSGTLDVNVDDQTIEISGDALNVKDGGITDAKIASVSDTKITTACSDGQVLSASSGNFVCANAGALGSWSLNGTDLYYNGGNVGIGTSSPRGVLDISNSFTVKKLPNFSLGSGGIDDEYLVIAKSYEGVNLESSGVIGRIVGSRGSAVTGNRVLDLKISVQSGYNSDSIYQFLNFGEKIFTSLDKISIDGVNYLALKAVPSGGGLHNAFYFEGFLNNNFSDLILTKVRLSDANVSLITSEVALPVTSVTADVNGFVGIGTNSPDRKIDVVGNSRFRLQNAESFEINSIMSTDVNNWGALNLGVTSIGTSTSHRSAMRIALESSSTESIFSGLRILDNSLTANMSYGIYVGAGNNNYFSGKVGIGNSSPSAMLDVNGQVKISGGSPGAGKVLTSDANGLASWQAPASTGITSLTAGTGLTGGTITSSGTIAVDVGTGANQIVQLDGSSKLPAVDGSQLTNLPNPTTSTVLTGFTTGADSSVLNTDTLEVAIEKLQGQIDGNNTDISTNSTSLLSKVDKTTTVNGQALSGNISLTKSDIGLSNVTNDAQLKAADLDTTVTLGTSDTKVPSQAAVKSYVDTQVGALTSSQWSTSGSNIYYNAGNVGVGTASPSAPFMISSATGLGQNQLTLEDQTNSKYLSIGSNLGRYKITTTHDRLTLDVQGNDALNILPSGNVGIGTTSPTNKLSIDSGSLGTNIGDSTSDFSLKSLVTNQSNLEFKHRRHTAGTNWDGTNIRIQKTIDVTPMGFIDFGIDGLSANKGIGFGSGSSTNMVLLENGNVGIGTSNPTEKLQIDGTTAYIQLNDSDGVLGGNMNSGIRLYANGVEHGALGYPGTANGILYLRNFEGDVRIEADERSTKTDTKIVFDIDGAEKVRIDSNGRVGIGTTSPTGMLDVASTTSHTLVNGGNIEIQRNEALSPETGGLIDFKKLITDDFRARIYHSDALGAGSQNGLSIAMTTNGNAATGSNAMTILDNGNVGIGTINPISKLDIFGGSLRSRRDSDQYIEMQSIDPSGAIIRSASRESNRKPLFIDSVHNESGGAAGVGDILFRTGPASAPIVHMRIRDNGYVGIGNGIPSGPLHISTSIDAGPNSPADGASLIIGDYASKHIQIDDNEIHAMSNSSTAGELMINVQGGNTIFNVSSGNVGIGTQTPAQKLDVNGNIALNGVTIHSSDRRLKEKVEPLRDSLDKILGISGYSYFWKDKSFDQGKQIGVIAQEVEKDFPELVTKNENTGYLAVNYNGFIGHIIEAIKSIWSEISSVKDDQSRVVSELDEIRAEIKRLKDENQKLNERISELESGKNEKRDSY